MESAYGSHGKWKKREIKIHVSGVSYSFIKKNKTYPSIGSTLSLFLLLFSFYLSSYLSSSSTGVIRLDF